MLGETRIDYSFPFPTAPHPKTLVWRQQSLENPTGDASYLATWHVEFQFKVFMGLTEAITPSIDCLLWSQNGVLEGPL